MQKIKILLCDNDPVWRNNTAQYLRRNGGYSVITASSYIRGKEILLKSEIDVALIDVRLMNDNDDTDFSGIELARDFGQGIPIIIVTNFPDKHSVIRSALRNTNGYSVAVEFLSKDELSAFVSAIERANKTHIRIPGGDIFGAIDRSARCDIFVAMPFASKFDRVATTLVNELSVASNHSVERADNIFSAGGLMNKVWSALLQSQVIIADCTGRNANVFYEIGIAHTLSKKVILITQDLNDIPTDIRYLEFIEYENTKTGRDKLKAKLLDAITKLRVFS